MLPSVHHMCVDSQVEAGWIGALAGLGGAIVGATGALVGGWTQQRQQARTARSERREDYGRVAAQTALNEMLELGHRLDEYIAGVVETENDWLHRSRRKFRSAEIAALQIPDGGELRDRLSIVFEAVRHYHRVGENQFTRQTFMTSMARESAELIAAFLRGDGLPPESPIFERARELIAPRSMR